MLSDKLEQALNEQINAELASAYIYYSMSAYCIANDLNGMGSWFKIQAQEELTHAAKFFDYVNDRGGRVKLTGVKAPEVEWKSAQAVFEATLEHERYITGRISSLVKLTREEGDHATENFLQWFVAEQVEEEASGAEILGHLTLIGDKGHGLFMLDRELGQRSFVLPTDGAA